MTEQMWHREILKALLTLWVAGAGSCGLAIGVDAQVPLARPAAAPAKSVKAGRASPKVYEDDEIKVRIPAGWKMLTVDDSPAWNYNGVGSSVSHGKGTLRLAKDDYRLALAYRTGHASGILGGRFIEVFSIPWLDADQAWTCSLNLSETPQPANRKLMFINLSFQTGLPEVRDKCGISKDLGYWTSNGTQKEFVGEQRWFAGHFTTADRGWFFDSEGKNCGLKAYTLTSAAKTPEQLPAVGDSGLKSIVEEAIDIVDSIQYKRCPPAH